MRVAVRLLAAIWISVLLVLGGFAFFQVRAERQRLLDDLGRRATLLGDGLKEAASRRRGAGPRRGSSAC